MRLLRLIIPATFAGLLVPAAFAQHRVSTRQASHAKPAPNTQHPTPNTQRPTPIAQRPVEFLRDIAPILDRTGCSTAQCHGKFGGRGGLQLSLLTPSPADGSDPLIPGGR